MLVRTAGGNGGEFGRLGSGWFGLDLGEAGWSEVWEVKDYFRRLPNPPALPHAQPVKHAQARQVIIDMMPSLHTADRGHL